MCADIPEGNQPGATAFTRMPCRDHFTARSRVSETTAPLLAEYGRAFAASGSDPWNAVTDEMLMIRPPRPRSIMVRPTACEQRNVPVKLTPMTFSHASSVMSSGAAPHVVPELLTRMSMPPNIRTAFVNRRLDLFMGPHVTTESNRPNPKSLEFPHCRGFASCSLASAESKICATLGECDCHLAPEACPSSGHECDLSGEI